MLFDSHNEAVSGKNFGFSQYFEFSGRKLGPKIDQNYQFWVHLVSALIFDFERLFGNCLFSYDKGTSGRNFSKVESYLQDKGSKTPQKWLFYGCCIATKHLKIYNLTTQNATLKKLTTIMYLYKRFNMVED